MIVVVSLCLYAGCSDFHFVDRFQLFLKDVQIYPYFFILFSKRAENFVQAGEIGHCAGLLSQQHRTGTCMNSRRKGEPAINIPCIHRYEIVRPTARCFLFMPLKLSSHGRGTITSSA